MKYINSCIIIKLIVSSRQLLKFMVASIPVVLILTSVLLLVRVMEKLLSVNVDGHEFAFEILMEFGLI